MAKRFTDTCKWDKAWFRKLGSKLRDLRQFILDKCDHAGVIELDLDTFSYFTGHDITLDDINAAFRNKIQLSDDKIFVEDFIEFQYNCPFSELNESNKVHKSIIARLNRLEFKPLASPYQGACIGAKDKAKDKDKDRDKEKDKDKDKFEINSVLRQIEDDVVLSILPQIAPTAQESWVKKYQDPFVVGKHLRAAIDHYSACEGKEPLEVREWGRKLVGWLRREKNFPQQEEDFNEETLRRMRNDRQNFYRTDQ